jgi:hypothetical protein
VRELTRRWWRTEHAASSTIRRRPAAWSSLDKHLVRHQHAAKNPVGEVEPPAINLDEARPSPSRKRRRANYWTCRWRTRTPACADRAILSVGLQVGLRRTESAALMVGDLHQNRGYDPRCGLSARAAGVTRWRSTRNPRRCCAHLSGGRGARRRQRGAAVPAAQAQREAAGGAPAYGP